MNLNLYECARTKLPRSLKPFLKGLLPLLCVIIWMFPKDLSAGQIPYLLIFERCAEQYLMRDEGKARNAWAKKCFPQIDIAAYEKQEPPMYALVFSPSSKSWKGPTDAYASCGDWEVKAMCVFACYPFEERVHFSGGYEAIGEAYDKQRMSLLTMN